MSQVTTNLVMTRERAGLIRYEPSLVVTSTNVQDAIEQIATQPQAIVATPVVAGQSPYTPTNADSVLYVDTNAGAVTILLQPAAARNGMPITIKDIGGNASVNNITIKPNGAETIDTTYTNAAPMLINGDFGGYRLYPRAGVGYTVAP